MLITLNLLSNRLAGGLTLAGADEEVAIGSDSTKGQVHHRPGVTRAGEWSLSHRHGPSVGQETVRTEEITLDYTTLTAS